MVKKGVNVHQPDKTTLEPCHIIPSEPYTPRRVVIDDTETIVRDLRADEAHMAYTMFRQRAESGQGYNLSDFGTFSEFTKNLLHNQVAYVLEDAMSGHIIYIYIIQDAARFKRHRQRIANTGFAMLNPATAGSKSHLAAKEILFETVVKIAVQHGYRYHLTSTTLSNHNVLKVLPNLQATILGTIPDGIFLEGHGFTDLVIYRIEYQTQGNIGGSRMGMFPNAFVIRFSYW